MKRIKLLLGIIAISSTILGCGNNASDEIQQTKDFEYSRTVSSKAVDIIFSSNESYTTREVIKDSSKVAFFNLNMVASEKEYDVSNLKFNKNEAYSFVAKKDFKAVVNIDAFDSNNILIAHGSKEKEFKVNHEAKETNVIIYMDKVFNNTTSDYKIIPTLHDTTNVKTDDKLDYYRYNADKTLLTFDSEKGPYYQIDLLNSGILSCTSSNAEIKYMMIEDDILTIDLWSDELPYIYEYTFNLNDESNKSSIGENNFIFNVTDYEGNEIPTECNHEILTGPNYVTISSNGVVVGQVILPTEEFGECEVLWSSISGLTCEGQIVYSNKYAIATYVNGIWKQNKHENWESPSTDSAGNNLLGSGEGGACDYNFRYSIETELSETEVVNDSDNHGTYQNETNGKTTSIIRSDDLSTTECIVYDTYFTFDFNSGALFQISFEGKVLYTSECCPNPNYNDTYGVDIKNFIYTNSKIEFDLLDGEYSESEYAHYVISI